MRHRQRADALVHAVLAQRLRAEQACRPTCGRAPSSRSAWRRGSSRRASSGTGRSSRSRCRRRRCSVFSLTPVQAAAAPNRPMIAVPCVPRKRESRPAITSAAMRPCRLAGPASATRLHSPVTTSLHLDRVADREDVGLAGAHLRRRRGCRRARRSPARPPCASAAVRAHAERQDHEVGRIHLARTSSRTFSAPFVARLEAGDAVVRAPARTPCRCRWPSTMRAISGSSGARTCVAHLDQRHVEAAVDQVLGRLEADEAAADDHRARLRPHRLEARVAVHAGQEGRAAFDPFADRARVGHGAHLEDAGQVDAGQRRADRRRAGRRAPACRRTRWSPRRWRRRAARRSCSPARSSIASQPVRTSTANMFAEGAGVGHQQARFLLDHAADVVRQAAVGVRHIRPALDHQDLRALVQPAQPRRTRRAAGDATDDDDFHDADDRRFTGPGDLTPDKCQSTKSIPPAIGR